jgi:hypothetical protein
MFPEVPPVSAPVDPSVVGSVGSVVESDVAELDADALAVAEPWVLLAEPSDPPDVVEPGDESPLGIVPVLPSAPAQGSP